MQCCLSQIHYLILTLLPLSHREPPQKLSDNHLFLRMSIKIYSIINKGSSNNNIKMKENISPITPPNIVKSIETVL